MKRRKFLKAAAVAGASTFTVKNFSIGQPEKGLPMVKQMVNQAAQQAMGYKPELGEKFDIGTPIYYKFDE